MGRLDFDHEPDTPDKNSLLPDSCCVCGNTVDVIVGDVGYCVRDYDMQVSAMHRSASLTIYDPAQKCYRVINDHERMMRDRVLHSYMQHNSRYTAEANFKRAKEGMTHIGSFASHSQPEEK